MLFHGFCLLEPPFLPNDSRLDASIDYLSEGTLVFNSLVRGFQSSPLPFAKSQTQFLNWEARKPRQVQDIRRPSAHA